jgi:hypothetical protein
MLLTNPPIVLTLTKKRNPPKEQGARDYFGSNQSMIGHIHRYSNRDLFTKLHQKNSITD